MKKALKITAVLAFTGLALASCRKDYTCTCSEPTGTFSSTSTYLKQKQADAEATCDSEEASYQAAYGTGITCTLSEN